MTPKEHMEKYFKTIDGEHYILKEYKVKRMKELTTEINVLQSQIKKLTHKLHDKQHFLNITKAYKTFEENDNL